MKHNKDILTLRRPAIGIDISDSSLKIMLLKYQNGKLRVAGFRESAFPQGVIVKDEIKDIRALKELITEALAKPEFGRLDSKLAIASLPESKCFIRTIESDFPPDSTNLKEEMMYEAEQHIPLCMDEVYTDFKIIPGNGKNKVLFTAAPKKVVDPLTQVLVESGLRPVALEIESFALSRSLLSAKEQMLPSLIIDIGTNRTGLAIFKEGIPIFTSSLETAGKDLTERIKNTKKISFSQAEKIKTNLDLDAKLPEDIKSAVEETMVHLVREIKGTIAFFKEHFGNTDGNLKILLSGGGAKLKGINGYLSRMLSIPVMIGDPWVNVEKNKVENIFQGQASHSAGFATVIGLAIRGANNRDS